MGLFFWKKQESNNQLTATKVTVPGHRRLKYEVYRDVKGEWRWRLKSSNGIIIASSSEGYKRRRNLLETLVRILEAEPPDDLI